MSELVFKAPGKDGPGFLKRQRAGLEMLQRIQRAGADPAVVDEITAFLLPYVEQPEDRAAAAAALEDASQEQIEEMLAAVTGRAAGPLGQR